MCFITPDIIQWLLLDRTWRSFAWRLCLSEYIADIMCGGSVGGEDGGREKYKLEMLLRIWKEKKPDTYHISMLKTLLVEEVCAQNTEVFWMS